MNYYIIPKNNFNIQINPLVKPDVINPFISYSLIYFLNNIYTQLLNIDEFKTDYSNTSNSVLTGESTIEYTDFNMITFNNSCDKIHDDYDENIFKNLINNYNKGYKKYI